MSVPSETLDDMNIRTIPSLVALAAALGAEETGDLSAAERRLLDEQDQDAAPAAELVLRAASLIRRGEDPLGDAYCAIRSPGERRPLGQTYTPHPIIEAMLHWASDHGTPARVVDPGAGSGRYLLAAGRRFPEAELHGSDVDPLATLMLRANLAAAGLAGRARIHLGDYRALALPEAEGPTLFIGNPPYVRHHQIAPEWKAWLLQTARRHGLHASALAGLHVHFFLATAEYGRRGDFGAFITSSEWLDVNYGALVRRLLLDELGGQSLHVLAPEAQPFSDATTTGAITCFRIGDTVPAMKVRRVESVSDLGRLAKGRSVSRQRLAETNRWSVLTRVTPALPEGHVELGELCRVHRGTVTGANAVWVRRDAHPDLPERVLFPSITRARELFGAGARLGFEQHGHDEGCHQTQGDRAHQAMAGLLLLGQRGVGSGVGTVAGFRARHQFEGGVADRSSRTAGKASATVRNEPKTMILSSGPACLRARRSPSSGVVEHTTLRSMPFLRSTRSSMPAMCR